MTDYPVHPKAAAFRLMHDYEFESLVNGIRDNGLLVPITLAKWVDQETGEIVEGIIDGRNRDKACKETQIKPRYQTFNGSGKDGVSTEEEIADYILESHNRKNLTLDQEAMGWANLFPSGQRGRKPDPVRSVESTERTDDGFMQRVSRARYVYHNRRHLVQSIVDGTSKDSIWKIYTDVLKAKKEEEVLLCRII